MEERKIWCGKGGRPHGDPIKGLKRLERVGKI